MRISGCADHRRTKRLTRRGALQIGSLACGLSLGKMLRVEADQKRYDSVEGPAKSVIQIRLGGGVSAQEAWNPKPESPLEYRGPLGVCQTPIPGVVLGELLPQTAKIADRLTVVRSVIGKVPDHGQATYHILRGYQVTPALKHPTMGAVVNHEFGPRSALPGYIAIGQAKDETGYLSAQYGPFTTGGDPAQDGFQIRDLTLPEGLDLKTFAHRQRIREAINSKFRQRETAAAPLDTMDAYYQKAYDMIRSAKVRDAFDLSQESEQTKTAYGRGQFQQAGSQAGLRMLLARRLVEAGVRFVSLSYGEWDHHQEIKKNFELNMPAFDQAFAALIADLEDRGLLQNTLVWVVSEMGRTPKINKVAGRDHWSRVFSLAMAGGGLKPGVFYGDSDATSSDVARDAVPLSDLQTTLYKLIGINSDKELMAAGARPIEIIDGGNVVEGLLA
ncbi:MAG: DUF1501 domain-containing protein [Planctomycetaceae bacterium]|nr:DUF1501 domain-containing protein [Planctomycetaceae bacterium]